MFRQIKEFYDNGISAEQLKLFNFISTVAFIVQLPPGILLWRDSVPYLVGLSVWANFAAHLSAWGSNRIEVREEHREAD